MEAKQIGRSAGVRAVLVAVVPIAAACGLFLLGPLSPLIGTGLALLTVLWANRS
jgi:hypothetical protein